MLFNLIQSFQIFHRYCNYTIIVNYNNWKSDIVNHYLWLKLQVVLNVYTTGRHKILLQTWNKLSLHGSLLLEPVANERTKNENFLPYCAIHYRSYSKLSAGCQSHILFPHCKLFIAQLPALSVRQTKLPPSTKTYLVF